MTPNELGFGRQAVEYLRMARRDLAANRYGDVSDNVNLAERALMRIPAVMKAMKADGKRPRGGYAGAQQE